MDILQRRSLAYHALECYNEARDKDPGELQLDAIDLITDLFVLVHEEKNVRPEILIQAALHKFSNLSIREF
jgi:hypothetical protein